MVEDLSLLHTSIYTYAKCGTEECFGISSLVKVVNDSVIIIPRLQKVNGRIEDLSMFHEFILQSIVICTYVTKQYVFMK